MKKFVTLCAILVLPGVALAGQVPNPINTPTAAASGTDAPLCLNLTTQLASYVSGSGACPGTTAPLFTNIQLPASQTVPSIYATADVTTGWFQSSNGIWEFASGGVNTVKFGPGGLTVQSGQLATLPNQTSAMLTASGDLTTGWYQVSSGAWEFASGGVNTVKIGPGGLTVQSGQFATLPNQASAMLTASGDLTTGFYNSAAGVWRYASAGVDKFQFGTAGLSAAYGLTIGNLTPATLSNGELGLAKSAPSATSPGAAYLKIGVVCGTGAGTAKLIAYAGTSNTPATIVDNVGAGVSGC